jgi:glutamate-1-semialdehyde 2,1-aminomutase
MERGMPVSGSTHPASARSDAAPVVTSAGAVSEELWARALRVFPGGVNSPVRAFRGVGGTPRFVAEAAGATLVDVDGRSYTDYCMAFGPLIFGHRDPDVERAVQSALGRGWSYGAAEPGSLELAELIRAHIPWVQKLRFVTSGTEAVMSALRVARAATGRSRILKFAGCYHGHLDSLLVQAGSGLAEQTVPDSAGISQAVAAETLVAPLDDLPALDQLLERHGRELAAIIVEPLPANYGLLVQRNAFLSALAARARDCGALLIFDEVISGFRVAFGGMAELCGVRPDLVTYGKIIGGGFPVGAYGGRAELLDLVAPAGPVYQAGTLSANPVSMAAGIATLRKLLEHPPYAALEIRGAALARGLEDSLRAAGFSGATVPQFGSLFWMLLGPPSGRAATQAAWPRRPEQCPPEHRERFAPLFHGLLARGHYLAPSGFEVGFVSTAHSEERLAALVRDTAEVAGQVVAQRARSGGG